MVLDPAFRKALRTEPFSLKPDILRDGQRTRNMIITCYNQYTSDIREFLQEFFRVLQVFVGIERLRIRKNAILRNTFWKKEFRRISS